MPYPEQLLIPMRQDLTQYGVEETRTTDALDAVLAPGSGTVLVVVNSVCGCAAGKARPAVGMALQRSAKRPDKAVTVFAGGDVEATDRLRNHYLPQVPPSSPSMTIFRNGEPVFHMHRREIESRQAPEIALDLVSAFERFCA
ncbi:MAG: BrxA/BrxB family bacilliredoxin [Acidobacteria bacterium]|nr:BrxA/BrxB family bacilliredoxin [Acidobacteriota bacterium]